MQFRLAAVLSIACLCATGAHAQDDVAREVVGTRTSENIPAIPEALLQKLDRYQDTRGAGFAGWLGDDCLLVGTRFAETTQAHRVCAPLGMREQLTFHDEPLASLEVSPPGAAHDGFVYGKDTGGNEAWQLHWFDLDSRDSTLLTDGTSRNSGPLFSADGGLLAYSSTARNGTDTDVWVRDMATGEARPVVTAGGHWEAMDFSPDGGQLLVMRYVSINEAYPGLVDLASGELTLFPVDGGKAGFGDFLFAPDGQSVYFVSDEGSEFRTLRHHDPATGKFEVLTGDIPWNVSAVTVADDGRHLAFVTNEDGIDRLHVLALPGHRDIPLPELPTGLVGGIGFSPDGDRLALTLNTATSPSDTHVVDLRDSSLVRWTRSEVGGLDTSRFVEPALVRYPTFDEVDGEARTIPAFYYAPAGTAPTGGWPVVVMIHGGPESQATPNFSPTVQFLVNELGIAVLEPNVRGSAGYGKTWLTLDNGMLREDSVRDIGALLDWIATRPELDAGRVGVFGGSYGGYMVLASMMNYPQRIRAGVDIVGISHFGTFLENTQDYRRDLRRAEYGDERDPAMAAHFDRISPLNHAARITSPLFVAQGANDPRVPQSEAEQIVAAVRANGQPVWYLLFADEGHGFRKKANADYFNAATMLFLQRHLLAGDTQ